MEALLQYVWKHKMFPLKPLVTTDGLAVEVIDTGLPNSGREGQQTERGIGAGYRKHQQRPLDRRSRLLLLRIQSIND